MTDFNDPKPATATLERAPAPGAGAEVDPLASLHKMSTTAGISSQEYVAINIPSILALVLGLASVLAALSPVMLVIPVAALVTAAAALAQIRASNGTQTGRGFAWLGMALALAIGTAVVAQSVVRHYRTQADRQAIVEKLDQLGQLVRDRKYDEAYGLFSSRFKTRISPETFTARWEAAQAFSEVGRITKMEWNRTNIHFEADPFSGAQVGYATAWVTFEKAPELARYGFEFRKSGPTWEIDGSQSLFPPERPARGRR